MSYNPTGTGYAVPVDFDGYARLLESFSTTDDELQNVIRPGDFERADNVLDAQAANGYDKFGYDDLVGDAGIWYIWSDVRDSAIEDVIASIGFESALPEGFFHNILGLVLAQ